MELKIIYLNGLPRIGVENNMYIVRGMYSATNFDTKTLEDPNNYKETMLGIGDELTMDTNKRKSFTFNKILRLENPYDFTEYFDKNSILQGREYSRCEMLKYEKGDFFTIHRDTVMRDTFNKGEHKYTCLIFGTFEQENGYFEGGELVFKHPNGLYDIKLDISKEIKNNKYVAVIFSIDMYHEVLPIISGTRYVLKKPLFVKTKEPYIPTADELEGDGGFQSHLNCDY